MKLKDKIDSALRTAQATTSEGHCLHSRYKVGMERTADDESEEGNGRDGGLI